MPGGSEGALDPRRKALRLLVDFIGLQVCFLTWGVMQETLATTTFTPTTYAPSGKFPSPTASVLANRALAIVLSAAICLTKHGSLQVTDHLYWINGSRATFLLTHPFTRRCERHCCNSLRAPCPM